MRKREEIMAAAGSNITVDNLKLEVLLDIRDLLQQLVDAQTEAPEVDVQVTAPKKSFAQKN